MNLRPAPDVADLRAAWWARRALLVARSALAEGQLREISLPAPPALPPRAGRGVEALLRRREHTCLEGALVRQRWLAAHGDCREIAIGVSAPSPTFVAHAWLEGDRSADAGRFHEVTRLGP